MFLVPHSQNVENTKHFQQNLRPDFSRTVPGLPSGLLFGSLLDPLMDAPLDLLLDSLLDSLLDPFLDPLLDSPWTPFWTPFWTLPVPPPGLLPDLSSFLDFLMDLLLTSFWTLSRKQQDRQGQQEDRYREATARPIP